MTSFNNEQEQKQIRINTATEAAEVLANLGYDGLEVGEFIRKMPTPAIRQSAEIEIGKLEVPAYITPEKPDEAELNAVDQQIVELTNTNEKAAEWNRYQDQVKEHQAAEEHANACDDAVKEIEAEKFRMIQGANIPAGIEFTEEGIVIDGFPLSKMQLSKSEIYCAALRLASIGLGEVRTLHFDASPLDRVKLAEIEAWAKENDLQLLIERPDFDNGEIQYQILEVQP